MIMRYDTFPKTPPRFFNKTFVHFLVPFCQKRRGPGCVPLARMFEPMMSPVLISNS